MYQTQEVEETVAAAVPAEAPVPTSSSLDPTRTKSKKFSVKYEDEEGIGNVTRNINREKEDERLPTSRRPNFAYGFGGSLRAGPDDDLDADDEEDLDEVETQALLSHDRHGYDVSGHHLAALDHKTSSNETLVHLIKGNLGTGILAMPDAFSHSGLLVGCVMLPMLAGICIHCMHLLVNSAIELEARFRLSSPDFAQVGETAFANGPLVFRRLATFARTTINTFLTLTQVGFCCVYIVFMSANLKQVLDIVFPNSKFDIHIYIAVISILVMLIAMIKTLKKLYYPSLISNLLIVAGLTLLLCYLLTDLPNAYNRPQFKSWKEFPLFLATSIYAFEGIGVVLPLHRNMKRPEDLGGYNGVLNTAMILVTCLYFGMGFYGYLKYGDLVEGSITLNIPRTEPLAMVIIVMFVLAIYFTYALMLYVPVELIWPHLVARFSGFTRKRFTIYVFKGCLVIVTLVFAILIPHIGLFISLVGAFASSFLALIFPPMIHSLTFYETQSRLCLTKNIIIIIFGVFCFFTGTYTSIEAIVKALRESTVNSAGR